MASVLTFTINDALDYVRENDEVRTSKIFSPSYKVKKLAKIGKINFFITLETSQRLVATQNLFLKND